MSRVRLWTRARVLYAPCGMGHSPPSHARDRAAPGTTRTGAGMATRYAARQLAQV